MSPVLIFGWLLVVDMALLKKCGFPPRRRL